MIIAFETIHGYIGTTNAMPGENPEKFQRLYSDEIKRAWEAGYHFGDDIHTAFTREKNHIAAGE